MEEITRFPTFERFRRETQKEFIPENWEHFNELAKYHILADRVSKYISYYDREFSNSIVELYKTGEHGNLIIANQIMLNFLNKKSNEYI